MDGRAFSRFDATFMQQLERGLAMVNPLMHSCRVCVQGTALKSGLVKRGDLIHEVNNTNVYGMADGAVVNMIVGPPG